ncbi:MAG: DNA repair exonuclease [Rhodothermaceae bacterium]|nr:DNA repair exonuclease [Rhodothermaceae bacterium]MYG70826.1 DNA repair exonuclease [Rhodothermaceae bacterium]MYJ45452.1 DNA repair exonuclease [Rhodothermaceae bacterium]
MGLRLELQSPFQKIKHSKLNSWERYESDHYIAPLKYPLNGLIKLLCLGDAHLGRYPSRVPTDNPSLSVRAIWKRAVAEAIDNNVDAVILTGDMADNSNSYFEAYGALRSEISNLSQCNIPVVAVAGNHDHDVFPRLAESMPDDNLTLLGRNGIWEEEIIKTRSGRSLRCVGWSFPSAHYDRSPLDIFNLPQSEYFTVGIVHGALEIQGKFAPLAKRDLDAQPVDLWLLGHVHAPKLHKDHRAWILYPGSPQPLDPGEPGTHGPWMITIDDQNRIQDEQLPLASVRYEEIVIDVSGREQIADINSSIVEQLEESTLELTKDYPLLQHLSCRLILEGQTRLHRALSSEGLANTDAYNRQVNQCSITIDKVSFNTAPIRDLQEIAQLKNDPPGILARWLLELENADDHALLNGVRDAAKTVYSSAGFKALGQKEPDPRTLARLVNRQAMLLLDELLAQKEDNG